MSALYAGDAFGSLEGPSLNHPHTKTEAWFMALSSISLPIRIGLRVRVKGKA